MLKQACIHFLYTKNLQAITRCSQVHHACLTGLGFRVQGLGSGALGRGPNRLERSFYI